MTRAARLAGPWLLLVAVEVALYASYRSHDARFHWSTHFLVGGAVALGGMAAYARLRRRPARLPALWILAAHLFAMFPDFLFEAGHPHEWWMEVFFLHIRSHFVPGRNLFWLAVFLLALAAYLAVLERYGREEAEDRSATASRRA